MRSHRLRRPAAAVGPVERPAGRLDAGVADRLGRERERRLRTKSRLVRLGAPAVEQVDACTSAPKRRGGHAEAGVARGSTRPCPSWPCPRTGRSGCEVSMTPPQAWLNSTPSSWGKVVKKCCGQPGPGLGPLLEFLRRPSRRSSRWRRSRPRGSGRPRSAGSSGTGWPCRRAPGGCAHPTAARCSGVERLGGQGVVVDRRRCSASCRRSSGGKALVPSATRPARTRPRGVVAMTPTPSCSSPVTLVSS